MGTELLSLAGRVALQNLFLFAKFHGWSFTQQCSRREEDPHHQPKKPGLWRLWRQLSWPLRWSGHRTVSTTPFCSFTDSVERTAPTPQRIKTPTKSSIFHTNPLDMFHNRLGEVCLPSTHPTPHPKLYVPTKRLTKNHNITLKSFYKQIN